MARFLDVYNIFKYFLIIPLFLVNSFENDEIELAVSILEKLKIRHCVFVMDSPHFVKLNRVGIYYNLFTAYISAEGLKVFFNSAEISHSGIGIVMRVDGEKILSSLFKEDPVKVAKFTWILFTSESFKSEINIPYNCKFLNVQKSGKNKFLIKEIYHVKYSGPFEIHFGNWSKVSGLTMDNKSTAIRRDMKRVALLRADRDPERKLFCDRFAFEFKHREIWQAYSELLNFSIIPVDGILKNETMDWTTPDGTSCAHAHHVINFFADTVNPTCYTPIFMFIKFENDVGQGWKSYFRPFDTDLWWSIFIYLILSTASFASIGYFTNSYYHVNVFTPFYSFCFQGTEGIDTRKIKKLSIWIIYLMPYIAASVIVPAYSAGVLAKLMVQLPKVPFTDLESFYEEGTYKLGSINNTFPLKIFMRSEEPLISQIYQKMFIKENEFPNRYEEATYRMCDEEKFAFVPPQYQVLELKSNCRLFRIPQPLVHSQCGFRMRPGSPFLHVFNELLILFHTSGIMYRYNLTEPKKFKIDNSEKFVSIEISQVLAALGLVPLGIFLGLVVFIVEIFIKRKRETERLKSVRDGVIFKRSFFY